MADRDIEEVQDRLKQAKEFLDEAKELLVQDAEVNFVMNSLYYAFYYAVTAALRWRGLSADMQSTAIALFEREIIGAGLVDGRFLAAVREAFDLRPACSCEGGRTAEHRDVEGLLPLADEFLGVVERLTANR